MITINLSPEALPLLSNPLPLGIRGENEVTQVVLDFSSWVQRYGSGVVTLEVRRPGDSAAYPVSLTQSGTEAAWTVSQTDLLVQGECRAEYIYTVGTAIKKSCVLYYYVQNDIGDGGPAPDPYEDWLETLEELAAQTQQNAIDAEAASQAIQDMGVSSTTLPAGSVPTVTKTVDPETGAVTLTFGLAPGENGQDGSDGVSPTVTVTDITGGHRVTITDAEGNHSFDVMNGEQGEEGPAGQDGSDGVSPTVTVTDITGGYRVTITDADGNHSFDVMNGQDGADGADGADGYSPTVTVTDITGGHRVTITDAEGDHTFDVMDGTGGGGTSDYSDLTNKPSINSVTLSGNKTTSDLGLDQVFVAVYGTTTAQAIYTAATAGKVCVVNIDGDIYFCIAAKLENNAYSAVFSGIYETSSASYKVTDSGWSQIARYSLAPNNSPTFTGTPKAPTPTSGDNSTKIATTAFVKGEIPAAYTSDPAMDGTASAGSSTSWAKGDHVHPTDTSRAPLASPAFTGTPTAPTASEGTNTTQLATTAFVKGALDARFYILSYNSWSALEAETPDRTKVKAVYDAAVAGKVCVLIVAGVVAGFCSLPMAVENEDDNSIDYYEVTFSGVQDDGQPCTVTMTEDATWTIATAGFATLASPAFTGTPTAPTPTSGDNSTQIATTAFVKTAVGAVVPVKSSISLTTTWSGNGPYTQTVTVTGYTVTANTKADLQPDATTLAQLLSDGVNALYIENSSGALTAYAIGAAPTVALTVQCTLTEVTT